MAITSLGTTTDGRALTYDASVYEFYLNGEPASFADVQMLDGRNWVRWRAPKLRDWFVHIDAAALDSCNRRARAAQSANAQGASRVRAMAGSQANAVRSAAASAQAAAQQADTLVYRSDNEAVAAVDSNGTIMVRGAGTASIFAHRERAGRAGAEVKLVGIAVPRMQREAPAEPAGAATPVAAAPAPATPAAAAPAVPVHVPLKSEVVQSFKSKDGKLAKDKAFSVASCIDAPVVFKKTSGTPYVAVSEDGTVDVFKGLEKGSYVIQVQAVPASPSSAVNVVETIALEVRVK